MRAVYQGCKELQDKIPKDSFPKWVVWFRYSGVSSLTHHTVVPTCRVFLQKRG
jgi:hypothetical protein